MVSLKAAVQTPPQSVSAPPSVLALLAPSELALLEDSCIDGLATSAVLEQFFLVSTVAVSIFMGLVLLNLPCTNREIRV